VRFWHAPAVTAFACGRRVEGEIVSKRRPSANSVEHIRNAGGSVSADIQETGSHHKKSAGQKLRRRAKSRKRELRDNDVSSSSPRGRNQKGVALSAFQEHPMSLRPNSWRQI